ncbi:trimeric intracellular cation channel family protein [Salinibacillus xinjiangensis]|uniref:Trimeric intracellular cation channel family protein n=1 Tax=Salinibacillus xinjiangensis TaxID=1229268 RepID=A0A6G1X5D1_9BACI|nr:trimeric intracellular cation channel family protein [Salinibacillus xinjiangensis]MRG86115.1 trimeric intracellular cation channel family protein [Salinibacillus xinjiangensis]
MTWEIFNAIGTIAFAISGAIVALEEEYDILGVYVLGMVTAFGGGAIRNLLIGVPVSALWDQGLLFLMAILVITVVFLFPLRALKQWKRWGTFTDAIGLSTFAILGALYAAEMNHPLSATIIAALLTGSGGGMLRDVLAGRKPVVLREDIYGLWAMLAGLLIGVGAVNQTWGLYVLFVAIVILRMMTVHYKWRLPHRTIKQQEDVSV